MRLSRNPAGNPWIAAVPAVVLTLAFFAIPIFYTALLSVTDPASGAWTLANYRAVFLAALWRTILLALSAVFFATLLAYPVTYYLAFVAKPEHRTLLLLLLVAPFWTSFAIRAFSWQLVLADGGLIAWLVSKGTGFVPQFKFLYTMGASVLGLALFGTILISLFLYSVMATLDRRLIEASASLGASRLRSFFEVILPLSLPGWLTGAVLTLIICVGDYAVPSLLGGGFNPVLAQLMLSILKGTYDLPLAATFAVVLVGLVAIAALPMLTSVRHVRLQS